MVSKEKRRGTQAVLIAALSAIVLWCAAPAGAAPLYPDLRTLPPKDIHLGTALVGNSLHYVVRFSNVVQNDGEGALELHGTPHFPFDGFFDADQWIYEDPAGITTKPVGQFTFHPHHQHFHFDGFAKYELWTESGFARAESSGFKRGAPIYTSPKVSFCILDLGHGDTSKGPPVAVYRTCTPLMEGLSAGWADVYDYLLPDQWIDVGEKPLPDGQYVIRSIVDPSNVLYESDNKAVASRESDVANSAITYFSIVNGRRVPST
jgi:hypothetical protein